jgi:type IV pilus assembly protein PilM
LGPLSFGSKSAAIGLDIGTDHIRAAQLKPAGSSLALTAYDLIAVPLGSVVDGEIVDVEAVASAIRELWRKAGMAGKDVAIGVANQKVVVRLIDLPFMERAELKGAIQYQAQDYIPIPVEDAILDFQIIGDYRTPADEHMMEVLLVAAQRDMIGAAVAAVEQAGLRPKLIDVTSFAIVRALMGDVPSVVPEEGEEPGGEAVGVIHVSSGLTNIAVVERGIPRFTRVSAVAGNEFTQAIANTLNLTFDEAEALKLEAGLPELDQTAESALTGAADERIRTAQEVLEREANKFIAEVRRSLDYYLTQAAQMRTIRRILLTGGGARLKNMTGYLEKGLQAQVILADPLARVSVSPRIAAVVQPDAMGCAPAIGLAMGGVEA